MPEGKEPVVSYEVLARVLFENYESIIDVNLETYEYNSYHESESYQKLKLASSGPDFFASLPEAITRTITLEDQPYVLRMLSREELITGVYNAKYYSFVYRIQRGDQQIYHQLKATRQMVNKKMHILMGIRNIDSLIRQEIAHKEEIDSMRQKESNYLKAVLATAAAYIEINLTTDEVTEKSVDHPEEINNRIKEMPSSREAPYYSDLHAWICENLISDNIVKYREISSREYLLACFERGEKRASVSFSVYTKEGRRQPCREVFYLYQEWATDDIHALCVIYDLTEQQKRERELEELELELHMSRIRNSTSQMQPHFLYNALGSIQEIILSDPEYASDLLGDFTVHLRSCIRAMDSDEARPFSQELDNIRAYVNIEKMRFGKRLKMQYDIQAEDFNILPLCIQPLVENAIRHGIYERGKSGGEVILRTREESDVWVIQVEDSGVGFDVKRFEREFQLGKRDSAGLQNIRFRLEKVMNAAVDIESTVGAGTIVTVRIPRGEVA